MPHRSGGGTRLVPQGVDGSPPPCCRYGPETHGLMLAVEGVWLWDNLTWWHRDNLTLWHRLQHELAFCRFAKSAESICNCSSM